MCALRTVVVICCVFGQAELTCTADSTITFCIFSSPSGSQFASSGFEHGKSFSHARCHPEEDLETSAFLPGFFFLKGRQQGIRIGTGSLVHTVILKVKGRWLKIKVSFASFSFLRNFYGGHRNFN